MKLKFGLKKIAPVKAKHREEVDDSPDVGSAPDWLLTDPAKIKQDAQEAAASRGKDFIPEIWLKDGDEKMLRFRYPRVIAKINAYKCKLKNGRYCRFTTPADGDTDLFRDELGLKPAFQAIYEVIDIEGYVDKKTGKRKRNQPKFLVVSHKVYVQLEKLADKKGGLNKMNIEMARIGADTSTTYTFMPEEPTPMTTEMKTAEMLRPKLAKFFAPLSESEQRHTVSQVVTKRNDD